MPFLTQDLRLYISCYVTTDDDLISQGGLARLELFPAEKSIAIWQSRAERERCSLCSSPSAGVGS